jgi:transcriptional antiterminator
LIKETLNEDESINKEALEANMKFLEKVVKFSVEMPLICDKNEIAYKQIIKNKIIIKATQFYKA